MFESYRSDTSYSDSYIPNMNEAAGRYKIWKYSNYLAHSAMADQIRPHASSCNPVFCPEKVMLMLPWPSYSA
ncbi:MAG: hypothetical protein KZQ62_07845, partial [Candidatus Thiodiazotropha sp. (ex Lucinoma aequizonata)]|nr:hypothetical protein [Candidatus Thiodiazotropha sp. (ex Lucinoma aequizonata)]